MSDAEETRRQVGVDEHAHVRENDGDARRLLLAVGGGAQLFGAAQAVVPTAAASSQRDSLTSCCSLRRAIRSASGHVTPAGIRER